MADTPRVTVPVEPTEAMMRAWHRSAWPQGPEVSPMSQAGLAFKRHYAAMLSAAPVPEGGAVIAAAEAVVAEAENIAMTMRRRAIFNRLKDALATREDAPAETKEQLAKRLIGEVVAEEAARNKLIVLIEQWDGESDYDTEDVAALADDILHAFNGPPIVSEEAPAEAAPACLEIPLSNHMRVTLEYDLDGSRTATLWNEANEPIADGEAPALTAQPQAREDAQPVAWRWKTPIEHVGDGTRWGWSFASHPSTPPASISPEPLYTRPAPGALRGAVEALEQIKAVRVCRASANIWTGADACRKIATEALAALQAEQKGGA